MLLGAVTGAIPGPVSVVTSPAWMSVAARLKGVDAVHPWPYVPPGRVIDLQGNLRSLRLAPLTKRPGANSFSMMITVGRTENNDIVLKHTMVSKFHAYFRTLGENFTLVDAGSLNGTWLDGKRCAPERSYPLKSGSQIKLGGAVIAEFMTPADLFQLVQESS